MLVAKVAGEGSGKEDKWVRMGEGLALIMGGGVENLDN